MNHSTTQIPTQITWPLRAALTGNSLFSFTCGIIVLTQSDAVLDLLGWQIPLVLHILGIGLVIFATDLIWQATRPRLLTWRALLTCVQDASWVIASAVLLIFFSEKFSATGLALVATVAAIVLFFGVAQYLGILFAHRGHAPGTYRHCIPVEVDTRADILWNAVGDVGNISRYYPFLKHSELGKNEMPGPGAVRKCTDQSGRQWAEEITAYRRGRGYDLRFVTDDPNLPELPFPVSEMTGGWDLRSIEERNETKTLVTIHWELRPRPAFLAGIILPVFAFQSDRTIPPGVERMAVEADRASGDTPIKRQRQPRIRLLPGIC